MLLKLPSPDFTMPFNVIMLTCMAMTFFYGFCFNLIFRRFYLDDPNRPRKLVGRIGLWIQTKLVIPLQSRLQKHKVD